jgi:Na+-driven multidrug efflux pump
LPPPPGNALLGFGLIRALGLDGAAIAASVSLVAWNVAMAVFIRRRFGLRPGVLAVFASRPK